MQGIEEVATGGGVIESGGEDAAETRVETSHQIDGVDVESDGDRVDELEAALAAAVETISDLEKQLSNIDQTQNLERLLIEAGVVDLETAMLLAGQKLKNVEASIEGVVSDLVSTKSFLFRPKKAPVSGSAVSGGPAPVRDSLSELAEEARQTGDRRAVLRYLRRRRG